MLFYLNFIKPVIFFVLFFKKNINFCEIINNVINNKTIKLIKYHAKKL